MNNRNKRINEIILFVVHKYIYIYIEENVDSTNECKLPYIDTNKFNYCFY